MLKDCQSFYQNVKSLNRVRDRNIDTNTNTNIINYNGYGYTSLVKPIIPHLA